MTSTPSTTRASSPPAGPASDDAPRWANLPAHRAWLLGQVDNLLAFYEGPSIDPSGGFRLLDDRGTPLGGDEGKLRELFVTTRMVHCFAVAQMMGRPGAGILVDHGMAYLWNAHRDKEHGGYVWSVTADGPVDGRKQAYGHAFVLLAAASALEAGHPDAQRLLDDVSEVLATRFWEPQHGASAEEFERDWTSFSDYRGQNANMHLTEACMAAFEATGDTTYLDMATSIATLIVHEKAQLTGGYLLEHFDSAWNHLPDYESGERFRPYGTTPGHWLEWARLCLQLWALGGRKLDWLPEAARMLYDRALSEAWSADGGFFYTLDWDGQPRSRRRLWWPCAEAIGAAHFLNAIESGDRYETAYRRVWDYVARNLIDVENGGWFTEPRSEKDPLFPGKPDLYHALQACLIPLLGTDGSVAVGLRSWRRETA